MFIILAGKISGKKILLPNMKRIALPFTVLGCFIMIIVCSTSIQAQTVKGKCTGEVLALNSAPTALEKARAEKKICPKKNKRINQSPTSSTDHDLFYYRDIDLDQVTDPYINTFPETASQVEESLRAAEADETDGKVPQKLSCKNQLKKDCTKEKPQPRRVRPSATVKLVKY